jgi:hypothetical protein
MVTNLKSTVDVELNNFSFGSTLKRSLSSASIESQSSFEEPSTAKKFKKEKKLDLSYVGSPREKIGFSICTMSEKKWRLCMKMKVNC